jgi:ABC-type transport system involved in multi-copper enzyme maturation permease subunit
MFALLKIEWLKLKKYRAFWWMLAIVMLTYPGINLMMYNIYLNITTGNNMSNNIAKMLLGNPYAFPETWHTVAYFSSFFLMLPSILVIMLIANEYQFRTHRQNIIDGWSRQQFITAKMMGVLTVAVIITVVYFLVALSFGLSVDTVSSYRWSEQLKYIPLFLLQSFAQLSIAFLLGFLIKRAFIALGIFVFYYLVIENILSGYFKYKLKLDIVARLLPFKISDRMIIPPAFIGRWGKDAKEGYDNALSDVPTQIILTIALTAIIWYVCYAVQKKRDL